MKLNVIGKSKFTEDGFTPSEYEDNRHLYKALQKVIGEDALYNRKTEIIGAGLEASFCPSNIVRYVDGMDVFNDSETFLKTIDEDYVFPKISGIVWKKSDDLNVVGYTNYTRIFLFLESLYNECIALIIMSGAEIRANSQNISHIIDKYFGAAKITVVGHDGLEDDMSTLKQLLYSINSGVKEVVFGASLDDFEFYNDKSDPKNHVLAITLPDKKNYIND